MNNNSKTKSNISHFAAVVDAPALVVAAAVVDAIGGIAGWFDGFDVGGSWFIDLI